jgi:hypothetical protein
MPLDAAHLAKLSQLRAAHARSAELELRELELRELIRALDWQVKRAMWRMARVEVTEAERAVHLRAAERLGEARCEQLDIAPRRRKLAELAGDLTRTIVRAVGQ